MQLPFDICLLILLLSEMFLSSDEDNQPGTLVTTELEELIYHLSLHVRHVEMCSRMVSSQRLPEAGVPQTGLPG